MGSIPTPALRCGDVYERNFLRRPVGQIPLTPPFQKGETSTSPPLCKGETEGILGDS